MTIAELKKFVEDEGIKIGQRGSGNMVLSNGSGPIGIELIEAVISSLEEIDKRIEALEKRANDDDINRPMPDL
jgi:hypothetical protein